MKKSKKYIIIGIPIIFICVILIIVFVKHTKDDIQLKINEININGKVIQLTTDKANYSEYENLEGFDIYDNKYNFEIEIQNPDILTYKDIKVGDSVDKLDFCNDPIGTGMIFYYETDILHKGYHLQIVYGIDPFDDTILSITYEYYNE